MKNRNLKIVFLLILTLSFLYLMTMINVLPNKLMISSFLLSRYYTMSFCHLPFYNQIHSSKTTTWWSVTCNKSLKANLCRCILFGNILFFFSCSGYQYRYFVWAPLSWLAKLKSSLTIGKQAPASYKLSRHSNY